MKHLHRPPALAVWLVDRFGPDAALLGDLIEEYGRGRRSRTWCWKQVLSIVLRELFSSRRHAFRWFVALPLAMLAVYAEGRLYRLIVRESGLNGFKHPMLFIESVGVLFFLMAATFVGLALWVAPPNRRHSVARIALAIVALIGTSVMAAAATIPDSPWAPLVTGACILLGGTTSYLSWRKRIAPHQAPSTKH